MVRRIPSKYKRYLGTRRWGRGRKGRARGAGVRGGRGRAGMHKHKWTYAVVYEREKMGKVGFYPVTAKPPIPIINVGKICEIAKFKRVDIIEFEGKVLGGGRIDIPITVRAKAFSEDAKKKIEAAGGKIEIIAG